MHPATIGPFKIERELGRGGMGDVFLATDTRLDRRVAIKMLPAHLSQDPDRLARFQREAKVLASLNHPGIGAIYGLEEAEGHQYLILELIEGETLADRLARGPIPINESLPIAKHIADALEVAHDKGIIHRDLKPANVMLTHEGKAKVLDFGLARTIDASPAPSVAPLADAATVIPPARGAHSPTLPGVIMGTAGYMSPEQARGKPVDKRSDIFSFGCVLFEMLTGKGPFPGETVTDSLGAILHREPEWSMLPAGTPPAVTRVLRRCLAKDKSARLRDIADARLELESIATDPTDSTTHSHAPHSRAGTSRTRERAAWLSLLALALCLAAAGWLLRDHHDANRVSELRHVNVHREAVFRARFAPDGKTVIYSAAREGNTPDIYVARPESVLPESLEMRGSHFLAVSSQGEMAILTKVRYIYHRVFVGTLARMPIAGGAPREMLEEVHDADWTPDGSQLVIARHVDGKDRIEFPIGKVLCETSGLFSDVRFSPTGDRIAFFEHPNWMDDRGVMKIVDLAGNVAAIPDEHPSLEGLAWSTDGREVYYSAWGTSVDYTVFAAEGHSPPRAIYQTPGGLLIQDVARDGRWLVDQQPWGLGMAVHTAGEARDKDLTWLGYTNPISITPDGTLIGFDEEGPGMGEYYTSCIRGTDGSPVVRLGEGTVRALSPDGKWLLAMLFSSPAKLIAYPTGPGEPVFLERGVVEMYAAVRWFRDGKRICFCGGSSDKGFRYYVQDLKGGPPRAVTPEVSPRGADDGQLSPDESSILITEATGQRAIYPLDGGLPRAVSCLKPDEIVAAWNDDGSVLVRSSLEVPCRIERVDLSTGKRELFMTLTPNDARGMTAVWPTSFTADRKTCLYGYAWAISNLYVMDHR